MRLGKVKLHLEYVVDLDNESMVDHAKDALLDDIMDSYKYNTLHRLIEITEQDANLKQEDIAEFLLDEI